MLPVKMKYEFMGMECITVFIISLKSYRFHIKSLLRYSEHCKAINKVPVVFH